MSKPSRERKTVDRLVDTPAPESKGDEGVVIPDGTGVKLGEITNIAKSIQKADEDALKAVHSVLFGKGGKSATRKKNIRAFKGFAEDDEANEGREDKLAGLKTLKAIAEVLCIKTTGTKADIASRVFEFLKSPSGDTAEAAPTKKRKAADSGSSSEPKAAKKGKKGDKGAPVRPVSAYIQFSNDKRAEVREENPDLDAKDVMRRLGELWKELSTKDQEKYKTQAHKEWVAAGGPAAKKEYDAAKAIEKKEKAETKKAEKAADKAKGGDKKPAAKKGKKAAKADTEEDAEEEAEEEAAAEEKETAEEEAEEEAEGEEDAAAADEE